MPDTSLRSPELLHRDQSRLVLVDVQEKLLAAMDDAEDVIASCRLLAEGARLLGVPIHITEQYPQGLGPTVTTLCEFAATRPAKKRFSAAAALGWPTASEITDGRHQIVLAGVEAHVCVLQTAFDLVSQGYAVSVAADAVTSRRTSDEVTALGRLRDAGVTLTTVEAVLFEWCETAEAPEFKALSGLVKSRG
jgi:nicotinamidase-related amidase